MRRQNVRAGTSHRVGHCRTIAALAAVVALCLYPAVYTGCTSPTSAGVGSEVTNGTVSGSLFTPDGSPAKRTRVMLLPDRYDPMNDDPVPDSSIDTTDDHGRFILQAAAGVAFNIEAVQPGSGNRVLITGVTTKRKDTLYLPTRKIAPPGAIQLLFPGPETPDNGYVYLPGTTRFAEIHDGKACIDSVPAGSVSVVAYADATGSDKDSIIAVDLTVSESSTVVIVNASVWSHSKRVYLNTTVSGAGVAGMVLDFPVLVRLTSNNFDFDQAHPDGGDLRFIKENGTPLAHQIERWDAAIDRAEIWVNVDTVYGNVSTRSITMYWGNSEAAGISNGTAVFDTAAGFLGVWHLDGGCSDATPGNHDGSENGVTDTAGIIGDAKRFNGDAFIQIPGLLGEPQSVTLSAWVRLDSIDGPGQEIISIGDGVAIRADQIDLEGTGGFFCCSADTDTVHVFSNSEVYLAATGWRHVAYTIDAAGHAQSMYIDGALQRSLNDTNEIHYTGLGQNTQIGAHGNNKTMFNVLGSIDEVRVCRIARSADWIKLSYMNQKEQDALLKW